MELRVIDFAIIIYLVMFVITFWVAFVHLSRPNSYRSISAVIIAALWPVAVGILIILWVEALLESIRDTVRKKL